MNIRGAVGLSLLAVLWWGGTPSSAQELAGCPMLPKNNIWNTPIDRMPVHPSSATIIRSNNPERNLHPDFGPAGAIPINVVPADQPMVPIEFVEGKAESDPGPYPIPPDVKIEPASDAHALILQRGTCRLYEVFDMRRNPSGGWSGYSGAVFDLRSNALRPDGWTSGDAAGLPITPGLVRYDEIEAGEIRHAIRMTMPITRREYVWPARHFASRTDDSTRPPMGMRFRLRADYDISSYDPRVQVLLRALKKYGMILADNGQPWFLTGAPDARWDVELWSQIKRIKGSDIEAVDVSSLMLNPNSGQAGVLSTIGRQDVPFSPTPQFDLQVGGAMTITLTGSVTSSSITNLTEGAQVSFLICQDSQGGHQFVWPREVSGGMRVGTVARTCSAQQFVSDGKALYATSAGATDLPMIE